MLELEGRGSGDYFEILCKGCGERTHNKYLGWDPAVPHFEATCPRCGESGVWKLNAWRGLPGKPA
jgi:hypothetical protein